MLRWGSSRTPGSSRQPPSRQPVSSEDEAALLSRQQQRAADSASPSWSAGANVPPATTQQSMTPYEAAQSCTAAQAYGTAQSPYERYMATAYSTPGAYSKALQSPAAEAAAAASQPKPSAAEAPPAAAALASLSVDEAPSVPETPPMVTLRSVCCGLLLLLLGLLLGVLVNEMEWLDLGGVDPSLELLEQWLNEPRVDPARGSEYCADGLMIEGPARTGRNTLVFLALLAWTFLGVAIAADVFMSGIEQVRQICGAWAGAPAACECSPRRSLVAQITSAETTRTVVLPSGEVRRYTITVWNGTVANLTLMALGSSAPEILLSIIEIAGSGFYAGELGPSTIVGSAAFNMLVRDEPGNAGPEPPLRPNPPSPPACQRSARRLAFRGASPPAAPQVITAVCITAIPDGGERAIKELPVFYVTAVASVLAYVWLIVILVLITPDVVDVWEGVTTFVMFPILVYVAYRTDVGDDEPPTFADDDPEGADAAAPIGYDKNGREISKNDVSRVLALKTIEKLSGDEQLAAVASMLLPPQSRAYYRKAGMNAALGNDALDSAGQLRARILEQEISAADARGECRVQWAQAKRVCREAQGSVQLALVRHGDASGACTVEYATKGGSATEGVDFERAAGLVRFPPGVTLQTISVKIFDDEEEEEDEHFTVELSAPRGCRLGVTTVCDVTIQVTRRVSLIATDCQ